MTARVRYGVSEVVASMLLLLIVVSVGTALYLYLYYKSTFYQQRISQELLAEEMRSKQQLTILLVHGDSNTGNISVVVATGSFPVEVNAIYVNDTLAYETTLNLDRYAVEEIFITSPIKLNSGDVVYVKIVYAGGHFYVEASGEVT